MQQRSYHQLLAAELEELAYRAAFRGFDGASVARTVPIAVRDLNDLRKSMEENSCWRLDRKYGGANHLLLF